MNIDVLDVGIVVVIVLGVIGGYRRGFLPSATQYVGMVGGVLLGAALAPPLLDRLGLYDPATRPLSAALMLLLGGCVGATIGFWVGEPLRRRVTRSARPGTLGRFGGALLSLVTVLSVVWFLGIAFNRGPNTQLATLIHESSLLQHIDQVAPQPPGFLGGVEHTLAAVPFPQTFVPGSQPSLPTDLPVPATVDSPQIEASRDLVFRVEGRGCGGLVTGSAYPVAPGYLVTNAHVVSGTTNTRVLQDDLQESFEAQVVYFDPERDVAVLHVPGLDASVPPLATANRGDETAVVGYPGGGPEQVTAATIDGQTLARGRDIYGNATVTREIWVFSGTVRPGNSGGPLLDTRGDVLGVVFAASSTDSTQAYALTNAEIQTDLDAGTHRTTAIDTSRDACAV
ncbi:MAG: MarP family serine protease [Candidatus Dormiibacterota bacterium]